MGLIVFCKSTKEKIINTVYTYSGILCLRFSSDFFCKNN